MVEGVRRRLPGRTAFERDAVNLVRANNEGDATVDAVLALSVFDFVCGFGLVVLVFPDTNKRGRVFFVVVVRGCRLFGFLVTLAGVPPVL